LVDQIQNDQAELVNYRTEIKQLNKKLQGVQTELDAKDDQLTQKALKVVRYKKALQVPLHHGLGFNCFQDSQATLLSQKELIGSLNKKAAEDAMAIDSPAKRPKGNYQISRLPHSKTAHNQQVLDAPKKRKLPTVPPKTNKKQRLDNNEGEKENSQSAVSLAPAAKPRKVNLSPPKPVETSKSTTATRKAGVKR
jgi:hypothetical protein